MNEWKKKRFNLLISKYSNNFFHTTDMNYNGLPVIFYQFMMLILIGNYVQLNNDPVLSGKIKMKKIISWNE